MNTKIVIPIILLIMALMTGAAAAVTVSIQVTNDPIIINSGDTKTQVVSVTADPDVPLSELRIVNVPSGISVEINGTSFTPVAGTINKTLSGYTDQSFSINFTNTGASNGVYTIEYQVNYSITSETYTSPRTATIQAGIIPIPEFPTVALPIAAIVGLIFIISTRKKEE